MSSAHIRWKNKCLHISAPGLSRGHLARGVMIAHKMAPQSCPKKRIVSAHAQTWQTKSASPNIIEYMDKAPVWATKFQHLLCSHLRRADAWPAPAPLMCAVCVVHAYLHCSLTSTSARGPSWWARTAPLWLTWSSMASLSQPR